MTKLKLCKQVGCGNTTTGTYCDLHKRKDINRPSAYRRGYTPKWQKVSKHFLMQNPLCKICGHRLATVVDHIQPHKGNQELFWDQDNWQALCVTCHNRKTASEDMGRWY